MSNTELALSAPSESSLSPITTQANPVSMKALWQLAGVCAKSGLYHKGQSPETLFLLLMTGVELGLSPMRALRSIHIVQGRPVLSADLIVAICKRSPLCRFFRVVKSTADAAIYETHREGDPEPTPYTYLLEDAKRAGLTNKDNWKAHPAAMLRARCSSALARAVYPDLVMGLYDEDEGREIEERHARPAPVTPLHSRSRSEIDTDARKTFHPEEDPVTTREEALAADILAVSREHFDSQKRVRQEIEEAGKSGEVKPGGCVRLFKLFNERFPNYNKQRDEELRAVKLANCKSERAKAMTSEEPIEMGENAKKLFVDRLYSEMKETNDRAKLKALYDTAKEGLANRLISEEEFKIFAAELKIKSDELKKVQAAFGPKLSERVASKIKEIEAAKTMTDLENARLFFGGIDLTQDEDTAVTTALSAAEKRMGL